jgi:predicted MFS family arabinose efflux permease
LGSKLCDRFGARRVVILGGLLHGAGYFLTSFMPTIETAFISHSIISALGGGLMFSPSVIIVSQYFDRKRSLALGIATSGSGLGILVLAPLLEFCFAEYGYRGGWWIVGALGLHPCIAGALYRPLPMYEKKQSTVKTAENGIKETNDKEKEKRKCCGLSLGSSYKKSVLLNLPFDAFTCATFLGNFAFQLPMMLIVEHLQSKGFDEALSVFLIAMVGITDCLARPASGLLFMYLGYLPRRIFYACSYLILAVVNVLYVTSANIPFLVSISLAYGCGMGVIASQRVEIATDILGIERVSPAVGYLMLGQGIFLPIASVISGETFVQSSIHFKSFSSLHSFRFNPRREWTIHMVAGIHWIGVLGCCSTHNGQLLTPKIKTQAYGNGLSRSLHPLCSRVNSLNWGTSAQIFNNY